MRVEGSGLRGDLAGRIALLKHEVVVGRAVAVADGAAARLGVAVGGARRARPLVGVVPLGKKRTVKP